MKIWIQYNFGMEHFIYRNIVIIFDSSLSSQFIKLSNLINNYFSSQIVLNENDSIPHLTLYTTKYPKKYEGKIINHLEKFAEKQKSFDLVLTKKSFVVGTIFLDASLTPELKKLHYDVVDLLNPFRDGIYDPMELKLPGLTKEMKKSLIELGMWAAKDLYIPHVSIARPIKELSGEKCLSLLPNEINYFSHISAIHYVETGTNGTCKRIIESFPFGRI